MLNTETLQDGFALGDWEVLPRQNLIQKKGLSVSIEPQMMAVLVLIAARGGDVVATDELVEIVWQGRPMADNPVYKTIAKLRQALGDNPRDPAYIATVSKRGYRTVARVGASASEPSPQTRPLPATPARSRAAAVAAGIAILLVAPIALVALIAAWLLVPEESSIESPSLQPVATPTGSSRHPCLLPGGDAVVYVNDSTGIPQLWRTDLGSNRATQLTNAGSPARSPACMGTSAVLFERDNSIWHLDTLTNSANLIVHNARNPAAAADADVIAFEREEEVWLARSDGTDQRRVEGTADREQLLSPRDPALSPDGRRLVYFEPSEGPLGDLWLLDIPTGRTTQLTQDNARAGHPAFTADGQWIYFNSSRDSVESIYRIAVDGGSPQRLFASTTNDTTPAVHPNGDALVYASSREQWSLRLTDMHDNRSTVLHESRGAIVAPELSADGNRLAFFANSAPNQTSILILNLATRELEELTDPGTINVMPKWVGNNAELYYYHIGDNVEYRRTSLDRTDTSTVADNWTFNREHDAAPHPSEPYVIYAQMDGPHVVSARLRHVTSGADLKLDRKLTWAAWSGSGRWLAATDFSESQLPTGTMTLCAFDAGRIDECIDFAERGHHAVWSRDDQHIFFVEPIDGQRLQVWRYTVADKTTEPYAMIGPVSPIGPFFAITGREQLIWVHHEVGRSELWVARWAP